MSAPLIIVDTFNMQATCALTGNGAAYYDALNE
jgi:hypothetical protein